MALAGTWFDGTGGTNYTDVRCDFDSSSASSSTTTSGSYRRTSYGPCGWIVFMPNKPDANTGLNQKDPEYGYVYAKKDSDGSEVGIRNVWHKLRSAPATSRTTGEYMLRPFADDNTTGGAYLYTIVETGGSDTCSIWIYQPYAWYGRTGQVIAAMLLAMGVDSNYLDQTAFSAADDAQAAIGTSDDEEPYVFYRRQLGQTLAEAIKEVGLCCWDILTISMEGKIALMPRSDVPAGYTIASLDADDGVVNRSWRYAYDMLANYTVASEGRFYDIAYEDVGSFTSIPASCQEVAFPTAVSSKRALPFQEFEDATSQTRFGVRNLGRDARLQEGEEVKTIRSYHLPYLCNIEGASTGDPMDALENLMGRLSDVEAELRREVTVVQNLLGLDYDVGYKITSVELTRDDDTFTAFCTKKTIDFDDLSVTSVLLEEPS